MKSFFTICFIILSFCLDSLGCEQPTFGFENPNTQTQTKSDSTKNKKPSQVRNLSMLNWQISKANPESSFVIERGVEGSGIFKVIGKLAPNERKATATQFSFMDTDAIVGNTYSYRVIEKVGTQTVAQHTPTVLARSIGQ